MPNLTIINLTLGDTQEDLVNKINQNFGSIVANGGGPQGSDGPQGDQGSEEQQDQWGIKEFLEKGEPDGFFLPPSLWEELQELKL